MAQKMSVDIDHYHDTCQSLKPDVLQSESCRKQTIHFPLNRNMYFLVSACSNEWYCFKIKKPVWVAWEYE